jgi:hypothetical protein
MLKKKMSGLELVVLIITVGWVITLCILNLKDDSQDTRTDEQELNYRVESWKQQFNNYDSYNDYDY